MNKKLGLYAGLIYGGLVSNAMAADSTIDIGTTGNDFLDKVATFLQLVVDFAGGPGVAMIVILSLIIGVAIWIVAPKSGAIMYLLRAIVGGIGIMNAGVLYAYMKGL
ncbi:hypothetical protein HX773_24490 [Pantoea sp. B9002]|uniref:hypothetical protein n=1 Tax=Pantoea sp. B9002 TaxID=2726979 RepID=UPI0015A368B0|nr:hypothetical protein [Pantoea sp. B9002]NWA64060.1 hypothetical protein [Pantoea sp. B9002]